MTEANVSKKLREALVSLGAICWKTSDRFHASRPDLFIAYQVNCAFLEMKLWPNIPTDLQADTLDELSSVGVQTYVGRYDVKLKVLELRCWITNERHVFTDIKGGAAWLLEQLS